MTTRTVVSDDRTYTIEGDRKTGYRISMNRFGINWPVEGLYESMNEALEEIWFVDQQFTGGV